MGFKEVTWWLQEVTWGPEGSLGGHEGSLGGSVGSLGGVTLFNMNLEEMECGLKQACSSPREVMWGLMKVVLGFRKVSWWSGKSLVVDERS